MQACFANEIKGWMKNEAEKEMKVLRRLKSGVESQKGAVMIIEATFVFPIMFFIVFFMTTT